MESAAKAKNEHDTNAEMLRICVRSDVAIVDGRNEFPD